MSGYDVNSIRAEFPILQQEVHGKPLVYLDSAATSQKPRCVLEASRRYYEEYNSNIHRGTHHLAQVATEAHEEARKTVTRHLGAASSDQVIFTSGTTDSINLVASTLRDSGRLSKGDAIVITNLDHHSNVVPWQMLCEQTGAELKVIPVHDDGTLDLESFHRFLDDGPKVVAFPHISNAFGTVLPVQPMVQAAREAGSLVLIDGAQSVPHLAIDVEEIGADFYAFSGHKAYAPTGIGVLYGRRELLEELPPWRGGGEMIKKVEYSGTTYNDLPYKYEAGTPNIEGAIALAAAFDFLNRLDLDEIHGHEASIIAAAAKALGEIPGIKLYGPHDRSGSLSFNLDGIHHYDLGTLIDKMGVAVRTGHQCCQPLMARFGVTGTVRASFACFNTKGDVDRLLEAVDKSAALLR